LQSQGLSLLFSFCQIPDKTSPPSPNLGEVSQEDSIVYGRFSTSSNGFAVWLVNAALERQQQRQHHEIQAYWEPMEEEMTKSLSKYAEKSITSRQADRHR
jgi:hypothetical protein